MFWRGVWGYLPANIVQGVVGFLAIVIFTRLLSPEDFGRYALAFSVLTLGHVAVFSWLEAAMARFWAAEQTGAGLADHFAGLYRAALRLTLLFFPIAGVAIWLWPMDPAFKIAVAVGVAGIPVRCFAKLAMERYRAAGEVTKAARLDMATAIGGLLIGVGFALGGAGGAAPLAGLMLAPLIALPFILPGELKQARGGRADSARLKRYAVYGYPIAASLALAVVLSSTDRFLLAAFMNEAAVGAYHAGYSLANRTLDVLFIWLGAAGTPALVMALERGGGERLQQAAREQASTFLLIGLPAAAGVALVARPLTEVMIGEDLRAMAGAITPWIALAALLSGVTTYYFHQAFTLGHRTGLLLAAMAVPALSNVGLNLLLIPRFGVMGAAWATAISFGIGLAASILLGRRVLALPVPWAVVWRCGLATGIMSVGVLALPSIGGLGELALDATTGVGLYAGAALILNAAGVRDVAIRLIATARTRSATS
ncbi:lipopolysaccharide biosynthesis protein [uncultured Brevundimonas sp.]|uniref:lipopolysaccharide biosynthesis protein n=1 Tax=uncultured Brevundimonas sp. TaxID=213418 RepID=UPI0030EDABAD|tara:strand:+ start:3298 stop:4749 length:1452 start_codon:yes stop_codon:yes gene_type:complete